MTTLALQPAAAVGTGTGLRRTVAAEWTQLWTVRSTWWCLVAAVALLVLIGVGFGLDSVGASPVWVRCSTRSACRRSPRRAPWPILAVWSVVAAVVATWALLRRDAA